MKLLFAHVGIVFVSILVGVTDLPELRSNSVVSVREPEPARNFKIVNPPFDLRTAAYMVAPNLRAEFYDLNGVYIPVIKDEFVKNLHNSIYHTLPNGEVAWVVQSLIIEGDSISFQTTEHAGTSYAFTGSYRADPQWSPNIVTSGMDGQLTKFEDGVLIATAPAALYLSTPGW